MKLTPITAVISLAISLSISMSTSALANNISEQQMIKDITYLASDELRGRASFSKGIDQAADYISQRYKEIGLEPLKGLSNYKQQFSITNLKTEQVDVSLNKQAINNEHIAIASTKTKVSWQSLQSAKLHHIGEKDNMREVISQLNQKGGEHLVLIHSAHADMFGRYRNYFARGLTKLNLDHQGAIVMVLTDETSPSSIAVNASTTISQQTLTNVVGVLPGKESPEEIVLYSAHYDHLGMTEDGKAIFNGADDDASGTTAVINLAEYFSKTKNNRTLMFSAFTAEEIGGFGSQYFSKQLNPDHVIAMINIEMIGKPSKFGAGTVWMTGMERSNLGTLLNDDLSSKNSEIYADPYPEQGLFYRSDNATLARLGVPAHSFSSTQLDKDQHYHKTSDDISSLDLSSMHKVIESLSVATQGLVDGEITPTRVDTSKVRSNGKIY